MLRIYIYVTHLCIDLENLFILGHIFSNKHINLWKYFLLYFGLVLVV